MRILIIAVSIIAIGATAATIVIGGRSFDGLVVEKPYETGLDWDKTEQQKSRLGWNVSVLNTILKPGGNDLRISVLDNAGSRISGADVSVTITKPETTAYDRTYTAVRRPDGINVASIVIPVPGNWQALVAVRNGSDRAVYTVPLSAEGDAHVPALHH